MPPGENQSFSLALKGVLERGDMEQYADSPCSLDSFSKAVLFWLLSISVADSVISCSGGSVPFSASRELDELPETGAVVEVELISNEEVLLGGDNLSPAILRFLCLHDGYDCVHHTIQQGSHILYVNLDKELRLLSAEKMTA